MNLRKIQNTFNPSVPIGINEFWKQQIWIILWICMLSIGGIFLEKNDVNFNIILLITLAILVVPAWIEFIFIVKRYRSMKISAIWAIFIFIPPLSLLCFMLAAFDSYKVIEQIKKIFLIKEDNYA